MAELPEVRKGHSLHERDCLRSNPDPAVDPPCTCRRTSPSPEDPVELMALRTFNRSVWAMRHLAGTDNRSLWDRAAQDLRDEFTARVREDLEAAGLLSPDKPEGRRAVLLDEEECEALLSFIRGVYPLRSDHRVPGIEAKLRSSSSDLEGGDR